MAQETAKGKGWQRRAVRVGAITIWSVVFVSAFVTMVMDWWMTHDRHWDLVYMLILLLAFRELLEWLDE